MSAFLSAAESYVARGWRILPVHSVYASGCSCRAGADCRSPGKHPRTEHGAHDASLAAPRIAEWATRFPDANIAIATGHVSDLLVLDVDPRNGGRQTLAQLERDLGCLPPTTEAVTGGGGSHFLFRAPRTPTVRATLGAGIDIKFEGGYVVAAPSRHASGAEYAWAPGHAPGELDLAVLPEPWLAKVVRPTAPPNPYPAFERSPQRSELAGERERRARRYARALPPAISGQGGHAAAFLAASKIAVGFELGAETAFQILATEWNPRCLPPWSERDLRRKVQQALVSSRFTPGFIVRAPRGI